MCDALRQKMCVDEIMPIPTFDGLSKPEKTFPRDHEERMQRAALSLDGLSVGDALGDCFFRDADCDGRIMQRQAPSGRWAFTDDTAMALSIVRCLKRAGRIEQNELASAFARE